MATALIAATLVAGILITSLDPVGIALLIEGLLAVVGIGLLLPDLRELLPAQIHYRVPGLDLDVEIAVSTAN